MKRPTLTSVSLFLFLCASSVISRNHYQFRDLEWRQLDSLLPGGGGGGGAADTGGGNTPPANTPTTPDNTPPPNTPPGNTDPTTPGNPATPTTPVVPPPTGGTTLPPGAPTTPTDTAVLPPPTGETATTGELPPTESAPSASVVVVTVDGEVQTSTSSVDPAPSAGEDNDHGGGGGGGGSSKTWIIIGSVVGGIGVVAAIAFILFKVSQKRFSNLDDDDGEAIKWPELVKDGDAAQLAPMAARRREGAAGMEMSEVGSTRNSMDMTNDSSLGLAAPGGGMRRNPSAMASPGYGQPYFDNPQQAYYDPYLGPAPGLPPQGYPPNLYHPGQGPAPVGYPGVPVSPYSGPYDPTAPQPMQSMHGTSLSLASSEALGTPRHAAQQPPPSPGSGLAQQTDAEGYNMQYLAAAVNTGDPTGRSPSPAAGGEKAKLKE